MTSTVIGQGVIEVSADARKLKAGISDAKRSLKELGITADAATKGQSASIDRYIKGLGLAAVTSGKTKREVELYTLALRGASRQQLDTASKAIRLSEAFARQERIAGQIKRGFAIVGTVILGATIAAVAAFDTLIKKAGDFQDIAEKTGDTAENMASLALAAGVAGVTMEDLTAASIKLTKGLIGVDDETKDAGAAIVALGLNIKDFKALSPADQFEQVGKALNSFQNGAEKTAVAVALFGKSGAQILPFLKDLSAEGGRQFILTEKQIQQADEFAKGQARLRTEIGLYSQAIASDLIPSIQSFTSVLRDIVKDQELAAAAATGLRIVGNASIAVFQTLAFAAGLVAHGINLIAIQAKGAYEQVKALGTLDFQAFRNAARVMERDMDKSTQTLEKFSLTLLKMSEKPVKPFADPRLLGPTGTIAEQTADIRPKLKFTGSDGAIKAAEEAKARLAAEVEAIKARGDSVVSINANIEKILEANRSAALVDEKDFFDEKKRLLDADQFAQDDSLRKQIARFQKEKLSGKEKIENDKKIAALQALLVKGTDDATTASKLLAIQTAEAGKRTAQAFRDADASAQMFLATLIRTQDLDLAQAGLGTKERATYVERARLETEFQLQREAAERKRSDQLISGTFGVDAQKQYDEEIERITNFTAKSLSAFDLYTARRIQQEADWVNGARAAASDYIANSADVATQTKDLFDTAFKGMEDALVSFVTTGKLSFASLATSIVADITRIIIKQQISNAIGTAGSGGSGGGVGGFLGDVFGSLVGGRAHGGPVGAGGLFRVNEKGPELLEVAGKQFLMMGSNSGNVTPNDQLGGGSGNTVNISVNQTFAQGVSRATTLQAATDARRQLEQAGRNL
jgi:lambda family phage tail tape measure protein